MSNIYEKKDLIKKLIVLIKRIDKLVIRNFDTIELSTILRIKELIRITTIRIEKATKKIKKGENRAKKKKKI